MRSDSLSVRQVLSNESIDSLNTASQMTQISSQILKRLQLTPNPDNSSYRESPQNIRSCSATFGGNSTQQRFNTATEALQLKQKWHLQKRTKSDVKGLSKLQENVISPGPALCPLTAGRSQWHTHARPSSSLGNHVQPISCHRKGVGVLHHWQNHHCKHRPWHIPRIGQLLWLSSVGRVRGSIPGSTTGHKNETHKGTPFYSHPGSSQRICSLVWAMAKGQLHDLGKVYMGHLHLERNS